MVGGTPHHLKKIPEGPVREFTAIIEELPVDAWQQRSAALQNLIKGIPEGSAYNQSVAWYNSPAILRHLSLPVSELLKDPRSTVVKRTCISLMQLFNRTQSDARYLFRDLMPTILSVHAQTVQVIRQAVQNMIMEAIPEVPCKMVMPLWMERLKVDKSRTVRDACALYLGQALKTWTEEGYLTEEIWLQVGCTLVRSLRDPSPNVRNHAKVALENMRICQPVYWETLINDPDGPATKDIKLQRWLRAQGTGSSDLVAEDLSVISKFSYNSDTRFATARRGGTASSSSPRHFYSAAAASSPSYDPYAAPRRLDMDDVPTSIAVTTTSGVLGRAGGGLGPPMRRAFQQVPDESATSANNNMDPTPPPTPPPSTALRPLLEEHSASHNSDGDLLPQQASTAAAAAATSAKLNNSTASSSPSPSKRPLSLKDRALERVAVLRHTRSQEGLDHDDDPSKKSGQSPTAAATSSKNIASVEPAAAATTTSSTTTQEGPFLTNMRKLKETASRRRSRNSILMQERFRLSSSNVGSSSSNVSLADSTKEENKESTPKTAPPTTKQDEKDETAEVSGKRSEEENEVPNTPPKPVAVSSSSAGLPPTPPTFVPAKTNKATTSTTTTTTITTPAGAPEHMVIAIRLLRSHKVHVDRIMETLKLEMEALRDFDSLLEKAGRPTEEETLDYFETVGLCLDQRAQAAVHLQHELDLISRGEPPEEDQYQ